MAGDWIKLEICTPDKPEMLRMADILGLPLEHVLGCVIRVWIWADQQSIDGNDIRVTEAQLDRIACNAGVTHALCEVGWARKLSTGYSLPNFGGHNGESAKKRALTAKRVAKFRNANVTPQSLPEKRREDIKASRIAREPEPLPAAHSTAKAHQAIQEALQAKESAVPMPEHLRAILKARTKE